MSDYILSPQIARGLSDKLYDKRKSAALEVEKNIHGYIYHDQKDKIAKTISALVEDFVYSLSPNARNGGLIGLAAASISLGNGVPSYLDRIVPPVIMCFADQDSCVRYYACESMYNIAKVARGSILRYFNELFDAMSKLYADQELSVTGGAELLDRLVKDIVHEQSVVYSGPITHIDDQDPQQLALSLPRESQFSLPRFIPLLAERVYSKNSRTRNYLVTWIEVLDSIPDLELVAYLPDFLDGLLYFLSDSNPDVKTLTQKLLNDFLTEIREVAELQQQQQHEQLQARLKQLQMQEGQKRSSFDDLSVSGDFDLLENESTGHGKGNWVPGQGVKVNYAKIVKILKPHLTSTDEDIQETALRWINEFMSLAKDVMIQFTPTLIPAVLPCLAHSVDSIRAIANETNLSLYTLVLESALPPKPQHTSSPLDVITSERPLHPPRSPRIEDRSTMSFGTSGSLASKISANSAPKDQTKDTVGRAASPTPQKPVTDQLEFDYVATVHALTLQFLNEHEQTRIASLEWLLMLHKRAPHLILAIDDGSFPVLLKTLSDPSEEVIKRDLQLLAQISSYSDDAYFYNFMLNLLSLFSTENQLLEVRGSVIIRQLCVSLNSEKIYRTLAEILEKDEDLEFANTMVQNLNIILITAPELADLRRRLKSTDSRSNPNSDGQALFTALYKSWCHNPVSTFSLCLMAQYYEHAVELLQTFAEFEITVNLLIQIDKLVQLLESPVFTYLRLQLLEPERYPHLFKCLYGLLMLLPQSTAFVTLRNRLTSVSSMGFIHLVPKIPNKGSAQSSAQGSSQSSSTVPGTMGAARAKAGALVTTSAYGGNSASYHTEGPKFAELLTQFKTVQIRHERSRRQALQAQLRMNTYGNSGSGLAGTAHYNQQHLYYQKHQQKHQRKHQQQLEHLQLQQQVQHQQQLYGLAHQQQSGASEGFNSSSSSRSHYQDGAYHKDHSHQAESSNDQDYERQGSNNASVPRRKTRDRHSQFDIMQQQQQQQQQQQSQQSTTPLNQRTSFTKSSQGNANSRSHASNSASTPPPTNHSMTVASSSAGGGVGGSSLGTISPSASPATGSGSG
ncbi:PtdIns(3,5)P(2) sythesis regulation factor [Lobosporangium transversale]|uniref:Vacuolar protein 14 C-terminal Fig4p binding-domain-containing protein n=1 Tax=Lobosporangium transversale TaxID=64571 RepID=A0A1Y2GFU8_9FUNG|nr:vacuolar protein 14 C-terminal Fig4p binding-domain-containing protein [Lobosporangium transversale]KAF9915942.1 PtdIns(3,5)P(2) sythesis regulation factor [Lobosporangium transversale]ORZ09669.1 vacuolar protein 14 C-terminal Fig4p binding-domain-containing protein [Lobosporangium transversale]|eukprot:XP_021878939.1 vacuolar protein 14 C-terminal Fig4p binding-domain-containing protein [Lobosporangium transversale]